jgi:hypothetical protein
MLLKLFHKIERKVTLPDSSYEAGITVIKEKKKSQIRTQGNKKKRLSY